VDDVVQGDYVGVFQFFEKGSFPDRREGSALLFLESNLFQSYDLVL
jgi:hypothetical protein